jgi:hypothetical protein
VAHDQDLALASNGFELVQSGENEDGGLTETGLGLAKNIDIQNGSRDADLLDCWEAEPMLDCVRQKKETENICLAMSVHPRQHQIGAWAIIFHRLPSHHDCMSYPKA